ncbi:MAG: Peptidase-S11 domain-containing protein [Burkholderia sp.]|jgi:serine-type D-Ala-D-Ala endopeptidase (penicillin-binding protein 7)
MKLRLKTLVIALGLGAFVAASPLSMISEAQARTPAKTQVAKKAPLKVSVRKSSARKATARRATAKKASVRRASAKRTSIKTRAKARRAVAAAAAGGAAAAAASSSDSSLRAGLYETPDPLRLGSQVAFAIDQDSGEVLVSKNADHEQPIASITKLMTALVIAQSNLDMDEKIRIEREDYFLPSSSFSKLRIGMVLTRGDLLHVALMASDNRAAHALARTYPGGIDEFVRRMNANARRLNMHDTSYADPTGLNNQNHSTARDIVKLVNEAQKYKIIRDCSTTKTAVIPTNRQLLSLHSTNRLVGRPDWDIGLQKTGFTNAAGRCMVVQSEIADRNIVMVVLSSPSSAQRVRDMEAMHTFVENESRVNRQMGDSNPYEMF